MIQPFGTFLPPHFMIRGYPPSHVTRKFVRLKPILTLRESFGVRAVVGKSSDGLEVIPQTQSQRVAFLVVELRITGRRHHFAPGMFPCSNIANGPILKAITRICSGIDGGNAVNKSLHAGGAHLIVKDAYSEERELVRHERNLNTNSRGHGVATRPREPFVDHYELR